MHTPSVTCMATIKANHRRLSNRTKSEEKKSELIKPVIRLHGHRFVACVRVRVRMCVCVCVNCPCRATTCVQPCHAAQLCASALTARNRDQSIFQCQFTGTHPPPVGCDGACGPRDGLHHDSRLWERSRARRECACDQHRECEHTPHRCCHHACVSCVSQSLNS
jgi:hypothetical protein